MKSELGKPPTSPELNSRADFQGLAVIIPVWKGQFTIERSLLGLLNQSFSTPERSKDISITVAINDGCSVTKSIAESFTTRFIQQGYIFSVIETPSGRRAAFKSAEKNIFEKVVLYLDQDAVLSPRALDEILNTSEGPESEIFIALKPEFTRSSSPIVRSFLRGWQATPYVRLSPATVGAFAVSASGRKRWGNFPDLHSDDKFVRMLFTVQERCLIGSESYETIAPESVLELVRNRRRYQKGNRELQKFFGGKQHLQDISRFSGPIDVFCNPSKWFDFMVVGLISGIVFVWRIIDNLSGRATRL